MTTTPTSGMSPGRVLVKTMGCKANLYDSQQISQAFLDRGFSTVSESEWSLPEQTNGPHLDVCVINTCTVTDDANRESRKLASRMARKNPRARVVVTGCGAEVDPDYYKNTSGIHFVVGNRDKPKLVDLVLKSIEASPARETLGEFVGKTQGYGEMLARHPMDREWPMPSESFFAPERMLEGEARRTRVFLKIQEGCNSFCTYCIIPFGRGPSRSLDINSLVEQVRMLVESGTREVILTGTNIGDYGMDWAGEGSPRGKPLEDLVSAFFARTNLERLRISSLDPTEITPGLLEIARSEPRFCPHFHVSLQSPHAKILRLMKRRYGLNEIESCLNAISALPAPLGGAYIGMDVITGFPGESLEDFEESVAVLKRLPWTRLHVFPYSEREGTAATRLPHAVPREERLRRTRVLNDLSVERLAQFHSQISGTVSSVLFENPCRGPDQTLNWLGGYTPNYVRVLVPKTGLLAPNQIHNVTIESVWEENRGGGDFSLVGKTIQ